MALRPNITAPEKGYMYETEDWNRYEDELNRLNINTGSPWVPRNPIQAPVQTPITTNLNPNTTPTLRTVARPTLSSGSMGFTKGGGTNPGGTTPGGIPAYDMNKVESLAQRASAPGVRRLRTAMGEVQQGYYENPNVKRMTIRDALAGYGQGLEDVMGGAFKTGAGIYGQEYGLQGQAALQANQIASQQSMQANQIGSNERMNKYNNEWREYLASLGR